jgi:hypothetical protein
MVQHSGTINARQIDTIKRELDTIVAEGAPPRFPLKRDLFQEIYTSTFYGEILPL